MKDKANNKKGKKKKNDFTNHPSDVRILGKEGTWWSSTRIDRHRNKAREEHECEELEHTFLLCHSQTEETILLQQLDCKEEKTRNTKPKNRWDKRRKRKRSMGDGWVPKNQKHTVQLHLKATTNNTSTQNKHETLKWRKKQGKQLTGSDANAETTKIKSRKVVFMSRKSRDRLFERQSCVWKEVDVFWNLDSYERGQRRGKHEELLQRVWTKTIQNGFPVTIHSQQSFSPVLALSLSVSSSLGFFFKCRFLSLVSLFRFSSFSCLFLFLASFQVGA